MSQKAFLAGFDAAIIGGFKAAGMADDAFYSAPNGQAGESIRCDVMVDRGIQAWGDDPMPVASGSVTVRFQRAQVVPVKGGFVVVDGDRYRLTDLLSDDGSMIRFAVTRG